MPDIRPQLNFATDLDRVVALNSQIGLMTQKLQTIERVSQAIWRSDPFANMTVQVRNATGGLSAMLARLTDIHSKLVAIDNVKAFGGMKPTTGSMAVGGAAATIGGNHFVTTGYVPRPIGNPYVPVGGGNILDRSQQAVDPRMGLQDSNDPAQAREFVRQITTNYKRVANLRKQGLNGENYQTALSYLDQNQGWINNNLSGSIATYNTVTNEGRRLDVQQAWTRQVRIDSTAAARNQWNTTRGTVNELRDRVGDFYFGQVGQRGPMMGDDLKAARDLHAETSAARQRISGMKESGELNPDQARSLIKGLDTDASRLTKSILGSNNAVLGLQSSFLRLAGSVVGIQMLAQVFMQATREAVEFDRTLAKIRASASRVGDPNIRAGFAQAVTQSAISDSLRLGVSLNQTADTHLAVQRATQGTFEQKSGLGSTINNLSMLGTSKQELMTLVAPMSSAGIDAQGIRDYMERSELFKTRHGVTDERYAAMLRGFTGGIAAVGTLGDMDTLEASSRQEAEASRDRVMSSKLNRITTSLQSTKVRTRLTDVLSRGGTRDEVNGMSIEQMLNSGSPSMTMDLLSQGFKSGDISKNELLSIAQTMDSRSGAATFGMLKEGLGKYKEEVRSDKALVQAGYAPSSVAAGIATDSIGGAFDRMTQSITAATVGGIGPLGAVLKGLMGTISLTAGAMDKLAVVIPAVTLALTSLAIGIGTKKMMDMGSSLRGGFADALAVGGGGWKGLGNTALSAVGGWTGVAGIGVTAVSALGAYAYDKYQQGIAENNQKSDETLGKIMPWRSKLENAGEDALKLVSSIQGIDATAGGDSSEQRTALIKLVISQGASEKEVLDLQKAQTDQLREQAAIKGVLARADGARQESSAVGRVALAATRIMSLNSRGGDAGLLSDRSYEDWTQGLDVKEMFQTIESKGDSNMREALASHRSNGRADDAESLRNFVVSHRGDFGWTSDYGHKTFEVGTFEGSDKAQQGWAHAKREEQRLNSDSYITQRQSIVDGIQSKKSFTGEDMSKLTWGVAQGMSWGNLSSDGVTTELRDATKKSADAAAALLKWLTEQEGGRVGQFNSGYGQSTSEEWTKVRAFVRTTTGRTNPNDQISQQDAWDVMRKQTPQQLIDMDKNGMGGVATLLRLSHAADPIRAALIPDQSATPEKKAPHVVALRDHMALIDSMTSTVNKYASTGDIEGFAKAAKAIDDYSHGDFESSVNKAHRLDLANAKVHFATAEAAIKEGKLDDKDKAEAYAANKDARELKFQEINAKWSAALEQANPGAVKKRMQEVAKGALGLKADDRQLLAEHAESSFADISTASDDQLAFAKIVGARVLANATILDAKNIKGKAATAFTDLNGGLVDSKVLQTHLDQIIEKETITDKGFGRQAAKLHFAMQSKGIDADLSGAQYRSGAAMASLFGESESGGTQRKMIQEQIGAMAKKLSLMNDENSTIEDRLDIEKKIKESSFEYLKLSHEMQEAVKLKGVGDDMTKQTMTTLFTGDPTTRNKTLASMWTKLPMEGVTDRLTSTLMKAGGPDSGVMNPISEMAKFMFDPGGDMMYKQNIGKLDESIKGLIDATNNLANAYTNSADSTYASYRGVPGMRSTGNGGLMLPSLSPNGFGMSPLLGASMTPLGGDLGGVETGSGGLMFPGAYSLGGSSSFDWSVPGLSAGVSAGTVDGSVGAAQGATPQARMAQTLAANGAHINYNTKGSLYGLGGSVLGAAGGASFWKPAAAGDTSMHGVTKGADGGLEMTGAGYAVGGAQVLMAGYSGYMAGKATGSQAAANYGAAGGALGAGASAAFVAFGVSNPVGWVMLAAAALAQIQAGTAAAAKAAEDKTKAYQKQQDDFNRQIDINAEQRKQLGLAADRTLSDRADVGSSFTGVAASSFLSGRFAANAMQVNVAQLTVQANNPAELSAALAGTLTQQVGRGLN